MVEAEEADRVGGVLHALDELGEAHEAAGRPGVVGAAAAEVGEHAGAHGLREPATGDPVGGVEAPVGAQEVRDLAAAVLGEVGAELQGREEVQAEGEVLMVADLGEGAGLDPAAAQVDDVAADLVEVGGGGEHAEQAGWDDAAADEAVAVLHLVGGVGADVVLAEEGDDVVVVVVVGDGVGELPGELDLAGGDLGGLAAQGLADGVLVDEVDRAAQVWGGLAHADPQPAVEHAEVSRDLLGALLDQPAPHQRGEGFQQRGGVEDQVGVEDDEVVAGDAELMHRGVAQDHRLAVDGDAQRWSGLAGAAVPGHEVEVGADRLVDGEEVGDARDDVGEQEARLAGLEVGVVDRVARGHDHRAEAAADGGVVVTRAADGGEVLEGER